MCFLTSKYAAIIQSMTITIYLLVARLYKGELSTLPGIYFPECFRDFFDEISSRAQRLMKYKKPHFCHENSQLIYVILHIFIL